MTAAEKRKIRRVEKAVSRLSRMNLIYKLGGARIYSPQQEIAEPVGDGLPWSDCSGFACYLCAVAGIKLDNAAGWTGTLVNEGEQGTSPLFTLFIKEPLNTEGHVIVRLRKRPKWWHFGKGAPQWRWAETGGYDNPSSGGGPHWFKPTQSRVNEFTYHRKFKELS